MKRTRKPIGWVIAFTALALGAPTKTSRAQQHCQSESDREKPVLMHAEDGKTYQVKAKQTLGEAQAARQENSPPQEETTNCVPETMENKPEGTVACKCYEQTQCKGGESVQCKRHCKKNLCTCCSI